MVSVYLYRKKDVGEVVFLCGVNPAVVLTTSAVKCCKFVHSMTDVDMSVDKTFVCIGLLLRVICPEDKDKIHNGSNDDKLNLYF
jgi:hypothetical protein